MPAAARADARAMASPSAAVSVALLAVRLIAAARIGFGDSEALYAAYATASRSRRTSTIPG